MDINNGLIIIYGRLDVGEYYITITLPIAINTGIANLTGRVHISHVGYSCSVESLSGTLLRVFVDRACFKAGLYYTVFGY